MVWCRWPRCRKSSVIKISVVSCDDLCVGKCVGTHMPENFAQRLNAPELGPCACSQVRRTARAISSFYDAALSAADLTITQYAILTNIARAGRLKLTVLAAKLGMERTTLTRNLRPLMKTNLVKTNTGNDRRERLLQLTAAGQRRLHRSLPLWEEAQRQFVSHIGSESLPELRALLASAESIFTKVFSTKPETPGRARLRAGNKPGPAKKTRQTDLPRGKRKGFLKQKPARLTK
jgi:DNA-binding MarR family transcriptional regulator